MLTTRVDVQENSVIDGVVEQTIWNVIILYLELGFTHILPKGLDHILFVIALFLASSRLRDLVWQVSAFTVAHTITLALAILDVVSVPESIVEPLIALSIAFVAIQNMVFKDMNRWRPAVVFLFGLFHGLGFAGVLGELGLPEGDLLTALFSFNVGVELGQLTIIVALWLVLHRSAGESWYRHVRLGGSGLIALMALWWTIERVFLGG